MNNELDYDHIIIGAGPLCIIEACFQIGRGKKVLVVEERDRPAGAWGTIRHEGIPRVEIGCHIWDVSEQVYEFMEQFMNLELQPLEPLPRIRKKGVWFPYDWKMNVRAARGFFYNAKLLKFKKIASVAKNPDFRVSVRPTKYLYPTKGARDIEGAVKGLIDRYAIEIIYNCRVKAIQSNGSLKVVLSDEKEFTAKNLTMTSVSMVDSIVINGKPLTYKVKVMNYIHIHILITGYKKRKFSYDRILDHELIHRISDMTNQVSDEIEDDYSLLCVGVFEKEFKKYDIDTIEARVMEELKKLGYLKGEGAIVNSGINSYPSFYSDSTVLSKIPMLSNQSISVLRSTNFTYGVYHQLDRWKELLIETNRN